MVKGFMSMLSTLERGLRIEADSHEDETGHFTGFSLDDAGNNIVEWYCCEEGCEKAKKELILQEIA